VTTTPVAAPAREHDDVPRSISWEGGQGFLDD
jgi:hypothetical protein